NVDRSMERATAPRGVLLPQATGGRSPTTPRQRHALLHNAHESVRIGDLTNAQRRPAVGTRRKLGRSTPARSAGPKRHVLDRPSFTVERRDEADWHAGLQATASPATRHANSLSQRSTGGITTWSWFATSGPARSLGVDLRERGHLQSLHS